MDGETKICYRCGNDKPLSSFREDNRYPQGYRHVCKECTSTDQNKKRRQRWRTDRLYRNRSNENRISTHLMVQYGVTLVEYNALLLEQKGVCAICGNEQKLTYGRHKKGRLCIDHNHSTGIIRGLLCHNCNAAIGLMKENIEILQNAINYLNKNKKGEL